MQGRAIAPKHISHIPGSGHPGSAKTAACSRLATQFWKHSAVKEHTSNTSTSRLRLPAQCLVLFGSVETLCELVTLGHSEENIRSLDLGQSACGMVGVQAGCAGGVLWAAGSTLQVQAAPGHRLPACRISFPPGAS